MKSYAHRGSETPLLGEPIPVFLAGIAARHPDAEALVSVDQGRRFTYAQFSAAVDRLARGLLALGVERGDRVGIWSVNNAEWVLLQIATARVGAILVNVNPAYRTGELRHALKAARVETLFVMPAFRKSHYAEMVIEVCPELAAVEPGELRSAEFPDLRRVVIFDPDLDEGEEAERPAAGFLTWHEVLESGTAIDGAALADRTAELDADDPINIQFTSGTTGFAKPVVLTHLNILNNGYFVGEALGFGAEDRLCVPVPFYHCFGMVLSNLACLTHGAAIVVPGPHFDAGLTLDAVEKERCTALHGVPTMFVAELGLADFKARDLSTLRTGIMAGAPCPPELMRRVIGDLGIREILIAYGQTEASPVTTITHAGDTFEHRVETVGTNLPHQELKIVDPLDGKVVPRGEPGELCFRGYHVMRGYFGMEEATRETIDEAGWLHSGDLGVMDEDGYVKITGRLKEMIIRGGENVYPAEIEAYYMTHPDVAQAAVFGIPDEKWGEEIGAWIQRRDGVELDAEALRAFAAHGLAHFKVPRYLQVVEEFPMTVTGKIQKFRIRELVEEELGVGVE